jgi:hypothetical protein
MGYTSSTTGRPGRPDRVHENEIKKNYVIFCLKKKKISRKRGPLREKE